MADLVLEILSLNETETVSIDTISNQEFTEIILGYRTPKKAPNVSLGETVKERLKQLSVMNRLKRRTLKVIAEHLSVEKACNWVKGGISIDGCQKYREDQHRRAKSWVAEIWPVDSRYRSSDYYGSFKDKVVKLSVVPKA